MYKFGPVFCKYMYETVCCANVYLFELKRSKLGFDVLVIFLTFVFLSINLISRAIRGAVTIPDGDKRYDTMSINFVLGFY